MKAFRNIILLLIAAVALHSSAEPGGVSKFSGTVVDAQRKPVAGASVECYQIPDRILTNSSDSQTPQRAVTDAKGAFGFSISSGAVTVVAKKSGFASGWKTWQSAPNGVVEPLVLAAPATLAGIVADENDQRMADMEVVVSVAVDRKEGEWTTPPNFLFGKAASDLFSARTSADGHFSITNFPVGAQANFAVVAPGRALRALTAVRTGMKMQAVAGQEDIKLVADPSANIEGKILVRDTGEPLANVRIQLQPVNATAGISVTAGSTQSGKEGAFRISDIPAGSYNVLAIFTNQPIPQWVAERVPVSVATGDTAQDVKILAFKGGVAEVSVVGKLDQKGVPDVSVSAYSEGFPASSTTGNDGVSWFRLPPGQFTIFATKQGPSSAQMQTQAMVAEGETNRVKLELDLPPKIAGIVRNDSGAPVPGTMVSVFPNVGGNREEVKTDADGHYEVTWQKPSISGTETRKVYVLARNAAHRLAALQEINETNGNVDLQLKPAINISGRVEDANGNPITNATGYVVVQIQNMSYPLSRQVIRVNAAGLMRIDALPSGEHYFVNVSAKGYGTGRLNMAGANLKADLYDCPPLTLKVADRKLAGRVLGAASQPVGNVQVWLRGDGQPNTSVKTDAKGSFVFDAVCEGPVSLSASSRGLSGNYDGTGGDTNITIRFGMNNRGGTLTNVQTRRSRAPRRQSVMIKPIPLKPQPWTLDALIAWSATHKATIQVLLGLQATVLLTTTALVLWIARKRKS